VPCSERLLELPSPDVDELDRIDSALVAGRREREPEADLLALDADRRMPPAYPSPCRFWSRRAASLAFSPPK
jgi:hypothetical protein